MKIGILKSKVEKLLVESMSNDTFKNEIQTFKKLVLEDKNIAKAFYIYDVLDKKTEIQKTKQRGLMEKDMIQWFTMNELLKLKKRFTLPVRTYETMEVDQRYLICISAGVVGF